MILGYAEIIDLIVIYTVFELVECKLNIRVKKWSTKRLVAKKC